MACIGECAPVVVEFCLQNFSAAQDWVRDLPSPLRRLLATRESLRDRIREAEDAGYIPTAEVIEWLRKVEICEKKATQIINGIFCVQCFYFCCWPIQPLSDIQSLTDQGEKFREVASRPLPGALQEIEIQCKLFGLEPYLEKVNGYLAYDEVHMVRIWGMGGVGKTSLLQTINNALLPRGILSQRNTFDHVLFVVAARDYEPEKLQDGIRKELELKLQESIAEKLALGCSGLDGGIQAAAIKKFLDRKNFLLLLDDLWESVDLKKIGIHLHKPKHKVIFTTRSKNVCLGRVETIEMGRLNQTNARLLFEHNIGREAVSKPEFGRLSKDVISKCGGLPLALTTIAKALETDSSDWRSSIATLQQSRLDEILDKDNRQSFVGLYEVLKISYDRLSDDTARECFLSCALWPEGCPIEKLELIQSWMGLGLLDESINRDFDKAYNEGYRVIENLKAARLLEPDLDSENKVRMHGVIIDMALWIVNGLEADMKKWIVKEDSGLVTVSDNPSSWEATERISLMSHRLTPLSELPQTLNFCRLSSLMLQKNPKLTKIPHGFFQSMVALSFLDLSYTGLCELPEEIGSLLQLHYLNLSNTPISSLPSNLKNLKRLKYLLLNNTPYLKKIQHGLISSLSMLLVLDLFGCGYADWDCCSRASLGEFNIFEQGLKFLGITVGTPNALDQLSDIPQLSTQHLGIVGWLGATSLKKLMDLLCRPRIYQNLKQLKVENCGSFKVLTIENGQGSRCLPTLQVLELRKIIGLTQIIWPTVKARDYLPMIRELKISDCDTLEDVSWVLDLQHLERLELSNCKCMKEVVKNDSRKQIICDDRGIEVVDEEVMNQPFCRLRMLILKKLPALQKICDHAYDFLALKYLEVQDCQMLRQLPFSFKIKDKSLVIHGGDKWWNDLVRKDEVGNIKDDL